MAAIGTLTYFMGIFLKKNYRNIFEINIFL
jgi:hypothetical protein